MRTVRATRYVAPLREGGSLPGLMEADDDGLYVVKLRGAGQGPKALVSEILAGEAGRTLGLPVPELVLVDLDPRLAAAEPDPEIQELVEASAGLNAGLDFLPGALALDPAAAARTPPGLAADVVWFDALMLNVDRTPRNPNLLTWHGRTWLIDHGAALYVQHGSPGLVEHAGARFPAIRDHVLLGAAGPIADADARLAPRLDRERIDAIVGAVPAEWMGDTPPDAYTDFLLTRLQAPRAFAEEAEDARRGN